MLNQMMIFTYDKVMFLIPSLPLGMWILGAGAKSIAGRSVSLIGRRLEGKKIQGPISQKLDSTSNLYYRSELTVALLGSRGMEIEGAAAVIFVTMRSFSP